MIAAKQCHDGSLAMTEHFERPTRHWDGAIAVNGMNRELVEVRHRLAAAAENADWAILLRILNDNKELVNSAFRWRGTSSTLLHRAAHLNAPVEVIQELVHLGAFRTLKDSYGRRAVDVAIKERVLPLVASLEPRIDQPVNGNVLAFTQELFHGLIRAAMLAYEVREKMRLPQLSVLTESEVLALWFPIPGMYGGFQFWLEGADGSPALIAESWCRLVGGSGMRHRITPFEVILVEEGFV